MQLEKIYNQHFHELSENERLIMDYILQHKKECQQMTIVEVAQATLTSKSSVSRLAQKLGFAGYSEFKYAMRLDVGQEDHPERKEAFYLMQEKDIAATKKIFEQTDIRPILKQLEEAKRVFCYGTGWGQLDVLSDLRRNLMAVGKYCITLPAKRELEMTVKENITPDDFLIVVSLSGDIAEVEKEMHRLKMREVPILSITNMSNNNLASLGKYNLYFQCTPTWHNEVEVYSFLPVYVATDSLFRSFIDYLAQEREGRQSG